MEHVIELGSPDSTLVRLEGKVMESILRIWEIWTGISLDRQPRLQSTS